MKLAAEKEKIELERHNFVQKHQLLKEKYNALNFRCHIAEEKSANSERKLNETLQESQKLRQHLAHESNGRLALQKDNSLLRAQITDMSSAQEPVHEEKYYVLEFNQIRTEAESWAARETRAMPKQPLSETESFQIASVLQTCGEVGEKAARWLQGKDRMFFQERRNRITLIRHVIAVVLFDGIFDRFAFGLERELSECFKNIEKGLCSHGFTF
jgi:hypothetical protein